MKRRTFLKAFGYGIAAALANTTIGEAQARSAANPFYRPAIEDGAYPALQSDVETHLPGQLIETPFTLVENFEDQTKWTNAGSVTHANNYTQHTNGSISQKVTTTAAGGSGYIRRSVAFSPKSPNICRLRFYLHDANTSKISLTLATGSGNYWQSTLDLQSVNTRAPTKTWVAWDITSWSQAGGSPSWSKGITQIRCEIHAKSGANTSVSFDGLQFYGKTKPVLLLMADDGYQAVNTIALPYLRQKNMVLTAYVIPSLIGLPTKYMSLEQLHQIYDYGFDVANHTYHHRDLTTLTDAEVQAEWTTARDWLVKRGMTRAALHGCCPGGGGVWNDAVIRSTKAAGMSTLALRRAVNFAEPVRDWFDMRRAFVLSDATTLSLAKSKADRAYADRLLFPVLFHNLVPTAPTSNVTWNISDFQKFIDYVQQKGFISITISELYALRNGSLTVNHR